MPLCMQVRRSRVIQINRVQNLRLWTKYVIRRQEVPKHPHHNRTACTLHAADMQALLPTAEVDAPRHRLPRWLAGGTSESSSCSMAQTQVQAHAGLCPFSSVL